MKTEVFNLPTHIKDFDDDKVYQAVLAKVQKNRGQEPQGRYRLCGLDVVEMAEQGLFSPTLGPHTKTEDMATALTKYFKRQVAGNTHQTPPSANQASA